MMMRLRRGVVKDIVSSNGRVTIVHVLYDDKIYKAINYNSVTGTIMTNDIVYLNTTASSLNLGTGGYDFIIVNETRGSNIEIDNSGHIMKLRYTPYQVKCNCASEQNNFLNSTIRSFKDLDGMIVITGELHSMLAPTACCLKLLNMKIRIAYIMTDAGSLPIDMSNTVSDLKRKGIIFSTITSGNAFGGDYEAINIYDALIIAKSIIKCDVAIITMGPGIVGTGTKYGFTGIEQGYIIDCINTLKGSPIFIPRISFKDKRKRHYGISHHTLTVLSDISKTKANVALPVLEPERMKYIAEQIRTFEIDKKHTIILNNSNIVFKAVKYYMVDVSTMSRGLYEDKEFFLACSSAAYHAKCILNS